MKARDIFRAARNVVGRQTVAGGAVGVAVTSDDPWTRRAALLALVVNAIADFVIEVRGKRPAPLPVDARAGE